MDKTDCKQQRHDGEERQTHSQLFSAHYNKLPGSSTCQLAQSREQVLVQSALAFFLVKSSFDGIYQTVE